MSMEKSSKITMTKEDLSLFRSGEISDRLKNQYGITSYKELQEIVSTSLYEEI